MIVVVVIWLVRKYVVVSLNVLLFVMFLLLLVIICDWLSVLRVSGFVDFCGVKWD